MILHDLFECRHSLLELFFLFPCKGTVRGEQEVYGLERTTARLGEETVDQGDIAEHGGTEDVECLLPDPGEHDGDEQGPASVADSPSCHAERVPLGAQPGREDLGRVDEGDHEPRTAEDEEVEEDKGRRPRAIRLRLARIVQGAAEESTDDEQVDGEGDGTPIERAAPTDPIEGESRDERADDADDHETGAQQTAPVTAESREIEDGSRVDDDRGDPSPVLHFIKSAQHRTTLHESLFDFELT